jgi:hypothetical protein
LLARESRIQRANVPDEPFEDLGETSPLPDNRGLTPFVSAEELNKEFKHLGLTFDKPMRRRAANILAEGKAREVAIQDTIARGPSGFIPGAARFGAALVGSVIDPLNIVASFIPVVSQARFAGMVARVGRTQARLRRGFTEGVVGNALIEPVVGGLAVQQQLDYTATDALVNIALGGFIGGGLHVGGGFVADRVRATAPEVREAALRSSVAQMADGRRVDVEPVLRADEPIARPAVDRAREEGAGVEQPITTEPSERAAPADVREVAAAVAAVEDFEARLPQFTKKEIAEAIAPLEEAGILPAGIVKKTKAAIIRELGDTLRRGVEASPEVRRRFSPRFEQAKDIAEGRLLDRGVEAPEFGISFSQLRNEAPELARELSLVGREARAEPQAVTGRPGDSARDQAAQLREIAEREAAPEADAVADFEASRRVQETLDLKRPDDPIEQLRQEAAEIAQEPIVAARVAERPVEPQEPLRNRIRSAGPAETPIKPLATDGKAKTPNLDAGRPLPLAEVEEILKANREVIESAISRAREKGATRIETLEDVVPEIARFLDDVRNRPTTDARMETPEGQAMLDQWIETLAAQGGFAKADDMPVPAADMRRDRIIDIVIGPPASGKSSAIADDLLIARKAFLADSDEAKKLIPEFDGGLGANAVHEESSTVSKRLLTRMIVEGVNIVYPTVGDNPAKVRTKIDELIEAGYTVNLHMVDLPIDQALTRAVGRFITTGRLLDPNLLSMIDHKPRASYDELKGIVNGGHQKVSQEVPLGSPPLWLEGTIRGTDLPGPVALAEDGAVAPRADGGFGRGGDQRSPGRTETVTSPSGRINVDIQYEVVELDSLIASNDADGRLNPSFPAYLQPRDRTGSATQEQIADIIANFNPARLGANPVTSDGAPIVSKTGVVESGNVRTMVLDRIYGSFPEPADRYRGFIAGEGYDISGFRRPVLVRRRLTELSKDDLIEFTLDSNKSTVQALGIGELARADAGKIDSDMLAKARPGALITAANEPFVTQFINDVVPVNERNAMRTRDGGLSQEGVRRIEQALFARAYDDLRLLSALREDPDTNFKAIGNALVDIAPVWARMRAAADDGTIPAEMDITEDLLAAISTVRRARADKVLVSDMVSQVDMFSADPSAAILRLMFNDDAMKRRASQAKVSAGLEFYAVEAQKAVAGPQLFGDAPAVTPFDILDHALRQREGGLLEANIQQTHDLDAMTDRAKEYASGIRAAGACLPAAA